MKKKKQWKKKIGKNLLAFILSTIIILGSMPAITTHAATAEEKAALRAMILEMLETGDGSRHYVYDWNLQFKDYYPIWEDVIANEGKLAYNCYSSNVIQSDKDDNDIIINIYTFNADAGFPERYAKVKAFLPYAHEQMAGMTDLDKLIWVNDYLVKNVYYYHDEEDNIVHYLAAPLALGYGVCSGYAEAMQLLLENEGMTVELVSNSNHEWVAVTIDGKKYHVDPTWNDTRSWNNTTHYFLMRNDDEFLNTLSSTHERWYRMSNTTYKNEFYDISDSTDYVNWYVHDVKDQMHYYNGMWYYVKDGSILKNNAKGTALSEVVSGSNLKIVGITNGVLVYTKGGQTVALDLKNGGNDPAVTCTHSNTEVKNEAAAGCRNAGYTGDTYCMDCGILLKNGSQIRKVNHNWDDGIVIKQPTATTKGKTLYTCSTCQVTYTEFTDKLDSTAACGHTTLVSKNATSPTCTKNGKTADKYCADCNTLIESGAVIKAINHRWNSGVVTKEPTESEPGVTTYTCGLCGETKTEPINPDDPVDPIDPVDPVDPVDPDKPATPDNPTNSDNPPTPNNPDDPGNPDDTNKITNPPNPENPADSTDLTDPTDESINYNEIFTDAQTGHWYQFIKTDDSVSVMFVKPSDKAKGTVTIPAEISVVGKNYKVTTIADNAFKGNKKVTKINIGSNIIRIGNNAFYGCSKLKTVSMGATVASIGNKSFYKCTALTNIAIPSKVSQIGTQAFYGCKKLKSITVKTTKLTTKKVGSKSFKEISPNAVIKVPKSKLSSYKKILKAKGIGAKVKVKAQK